jgi:hypothetical protein
MLERGIIVVVVVEGSMTALIVVVSPGVEGGLTLIPAAAITERSIVEEKYGTCQWKETRTEIAKFCSKLEKN